jgi:hypothetical protein
VDRSVQRQCVVGAFVSVFMLAGAGAQAQTATSSTTVTPGLWKSEYRVLVNGVDSTVLLGQVDSQIFQGLPKEMKDRAAVSLNEARTRGNAAVCLTPQVAAGLNSPTSIFATFSKMNPRCRLVAGTATGNVVAFTGRCDDATSFSGNVQGRVRVDGPTSWTADWAGLGRFPDVMLTAMKLPPRTMVRLQSTSITRLVSSTCAPTATVAAAAPGSRL